MELAEILNWVLGGTTLAGIVTAIVYRHQNKRIKEAEAKTSESNATVSHVEAQRQEIELAELYKNKMLAMMEQMNEKQDSGNANQQRILEKLDTIDNRVDNMEIKVSDIVTYLNGDFQEYLKRNHKIQYNEHNSDVTQ